jgi:hypothetical protein
MRPILQKGHATQQQNQWPGCPTERQRLVLLGHSRTQSSTVMVYADAPFLVACWRLNAANSAVRPIKLSGTKRPRKLIWRVAHHGQLKHDRYRLLYKIL